MISFQLDYLWDVMDVADVMDESKVSKVSKVDEMSGKVKMIKRTEMRGGGNGE